MAHKMPKDVKVDDIVGKHNAVQDVVDPMKKIEQGGYDDGEWYSSLYNHPLQKPYKRG